MDGDRWANHWIKSKYKPHFGKFVLSAIKFYGDMDKDKGLQTSQDARFEPFNNKGQLVVQNMSRKSTVGVAM